MPSTYAHYRMGQQVRNRLHGPESEVIEKYPELYQVGLHGPDILFYYKALIPNRVNKEGSAHHERSGAAFFTHAAQVIRSHPGEDAYLAYTYGVLCHFGLDATCHGYINHHVIDSGVAHNEIETEFDRMLMVHDAFDPITHSMIGHIERAVDRFDLKRDINHQFGNEVESDPYEVISAFYPGISDADIRKSLKGMIFCHKMYRAPSPQKRAVCFGLMHLIGMYGKLRGYFVNYEPDPECEESNAALTPLYQKGEKRSRALIESFGTFLDGTAVPDPLYACNFEGVIPD